MINAYLNYELDKPNVARARRGELQTLAAPSSPTQPWP